MPYQAHPSFETPPTTTCIWRYTSLAKALDLLENRRLFFSRSDLLGDPLEGSYTTVNRDDRFKTISQVFLDTKDAEAFTQHAVDHFGRIHEYQRFLTAINCWRADEYESAAMWRLYASENEGIAVRSTVGGLCESVAEYLGEVFVGRVRYIDYSQERIPEGNLYNPYMYKRLSFDYEREVRAVVSCGNGNASDILDGSKAPVEPGVSVPVDIGTLASEIVVSPAANDWFLDVVTKVVKRVSPDIPVRRSRMSDPAVY